MDAMTSLKWISAIENTISNASDNGFLFELKQLHTEMRLNLERVIDGV